MPYAKALYQLFLYEHMTNNSWINSSKAVLWLSIAVCQESISERSVNYFPKLLIRFFELISFIIFKYPFLTYMGYAL